MILNALEIKEKKDQLAHYINELDQFAALPHSKALVLLQDIVIEQRIKRLFETTTENDAWGEIQYIRGMLAMHIDKVLKKVEDILVKEKKK